MHITVFMGFKILENNLLLDHQAMCTIDGKVVAAMDLAESSITFFEGDQDRYFDTIVLNGRNILTLKINERFVRL